MFNIYEVERTHDEVVVVADDMWDVGHDGKELVMSVKQARYLAEALMDATITVNMFADEEDA